MPEIEIKGKNVEEAIAAGLAQLGCKREDAEIKILDEGATGLFGLMGAKPATVLITADEKNCSKDLEISIDPKKACKKSEEVVSEIIKKMGIAVKEIQGICNDDIVNIDVVVSDSSFVIGKGGQTLDAIEYLTQIIVNNSFEGKVKVNLDCENYRQKQNEKLKILTDKAIEYVKRTKKIYRFEPMNAKERKIIHMYLKDNPDVESFSEGEGFLRKVGIKLTKTAAK